MQDLITVCVNNGVGIASFLALLFFANRYLATMDETIVEISKTLISIQENLSRLSNRVDEIEKRIFKEKE